MEWVLISIACRLSQFNEFPVCISLLHRMCAGNRFPVSWLPALTLALLCEECQSSKISTIFSSRLQIGQVMFRLCPAAVNQTNARFLFIFSNLRIAWGDVWAQCSQHSSRFLMESPLPAKQKTFSSFGHPVDEQAHEIPWPIALPIIIQSFMTQGVYDASTLREGVYSNHQTSHFLDIWSNAWSSLRSWISWHTWFGPQIAEAFCL